MRSAQLRLVANMPAITPGTTSDPTRQVFEHWLYMLGLSAQRYKLGPARRSAINAMLAIGFDVETLMLAIEGMAGDPLEGVSPGARSRIRDIDFLFRDETRVGNYADMGEALRQASVQAQRRPAVVEDEPEQVDPAEAERARERLRAFAAARREGGR